MFKKLIAKRGFTLLEILLVVGIIAILAGIVIIAINPSKQLATVRNTQRKSNLAEINKAVQQYYIDNSTYPGGTTLVSTLTEICNTGAIPATTTSVTGAPCGTLTNLSDLVPTYLVAIPVDPQGSPIALLTNIAQADTLGTGYQIMKDANNKIALNSQGAELGAVITLGPVVVMASSTPSPLSDGLIAHYLMNDNAATLTVLDTKGNNGTAEVNTNLLTTAKINSALSFNGTSDYINIPNIVTPANNITVSAWVYSTNLNGGVRQILSKYYDGLTRDIIFAKWDNNKILFGVSVGNVHATVFSNSTLPLNTWTHVVGVYDGSYMKVYINGIEDGSIAQTGIMDNINTPLYIGVRPQPFAEYWSGFIDDVRVYSSAFDSTNVDTLYNSGSGTESESGTLGTNLIAHYKMNDNAENATVVDSKASYTGTAQRNTSILSTAKINSALSFNGSTDHITSTITNFPTSTFTFAFWAYRAQTQQHQDWFFMKGAPGDGELGFFIHSDYNYLELDGNSGGGWGTWPSVHSTVTMPDTTNSWHHYAATYDGSNVNFYLDGVKQGESVAASGSIADNYDNLWIGWEGSWNSQWYKGYMDDFRIYNRALTSSEITELAAGTESE